MRELSPFGALVSDVRLVAATEPGSVFPALRKIRQAKPDKDGPLYPLHRSSAEPVRELLDAPPPAGLAARHVPSVVQSLLGTPPLSARRAGAHSRVGIFLDAPSRQAFVAALTAAVGPPTAGGPEAFVSASLEAEPLDIGDPVGLELACLFVERALALAELQPGPDVDVWAWPDADADDRRRVLILSRLAGRDAVFRADLAVGRGGIAALPAGAQRVIVVRGADDSSIQRWRGAGVRVLDVAANDCLETVRAQLCEDSFGRLAEAVARAFARAAAAAIAPARPAAGAGADAKRAAPWRWTSHARERAQERGISIALVDEHVVEPARDTPPRRINLDPDGPAQGRTVIVGECPATAGMPNGTRLYRGVVPGPDGDEVVILAVGWIPRADGSRTIHTLYWPAAHPESWNAGYTRGTAAGETAGDFPRGTRWFLRE